MKNQGSKLSRLNPQYIPSTLSLAVVGLLVASIVATGHVPTFSAKPKVQSSAASSLLLSASPNPIQVCSGSTGTTTLNWVLEPGKYEIRKGGEAGTVVATPAGSGSLVVTSVSDNTTYYARKGVSTTTYEWQYNRASKKWERVPTETTAWITVGEIKLAHTNAGCSNPTPTPVPAPTSSGAPISGTFVYPHTLSTAQLQTLFTELKQFGMDTVIISQTKSRRTADCSKNEFVWGEGLPGKLSTVFSLAEANNMRVYVGLISAWCETANVPAITSAYKELVQSMLSSYGSSSAFAGWYIPDEPSLAYWEDPSVWHPYWTALASSIKQYSNKPIIVSPILGGAESRTPAQIGARALAFKQATGIDIQAWQDSEQSWALNLNWQKRGTSSLADYFNAIGSAIGKNAFWSDIEVGNCCDGWAEGQGGAYYPASLARVRKQIESSTGASKVVSWIHQTQMSSLTGLSKWVVAPGAQRLGAAYRAWYGVGGDLVYLTPTRYTWLTEPSTKHSDSGKELTDGIAGDPKRFDEPSWVGIVGNASVELSFDSPKVVDWVGVHVLNVNEPSIKFPDKLRLTCKTTGNFQDIGSWNLGITKRDSEYVLSNTTPLNATCKDVRVYLESSGGWTFLSEVEIVGKK